MKTENYPFGNVDAVEPNEVVPMEWRVRNLLFVD